jgi:vancomycin resistance protein YoaR
MRLLAIRRISAGEEILVCYGFGYVAKMTKQIEEKRISQHAAAKKAELTAPIRIRAGAARVIICAKCGKRVTQSIRFSHARMSGVLFQCCDNK